MPLNMSLNQREELPYNNYELNMARDQLQWERRTGQLSRLQYPYLERTEPNVWEGESGYMEHIQHRFPLPPKRRNQEDSVISVHNSDSETNNTQSQEKDTLKKTKKRKLQSTAAGGSSNARNKKQKHGKHFK
nr:hypothetical protein BgiMline_023590 [Biomphalaria glabrata]